MADIQRVIYLCCALLGLISALHANLVIYNHLHQFAERQRRSLRPTRLLVTLLEESRVPRLKVRQKRRFWIRPGRTSQWWDNFVAGAVVEEEWRLNFRMSRASLVSLAELLRPHIEGVPTVMRAPVDVLTKVACTLYYLSDQARMRKTANAFGLSQQCISNIVRQVSV